MSKIKVRWASKNNKIKVRYIASLLAFLTSGGYGGGGGLATATSCPDVVGVFVRGSGEERWTGINYIAFRDSLSEKLATTSLSYDFLDLDYPAVGIDFGVAVSAFFSGGTAYEFGASIEQGIHELQRVVNDGCSRTKYVLGGYSQGAMVITKVLPALKAERVLYAATFGDPKLYLPEGAGLAPSACYNRGLSNYRIYVPDCFAWNGKLGGQNPYQPEAYIDKLGTWCNRHDIMCSPYLSIGSHTSYVSDNLYEDASRVMIGKITEYFGIENRFFTPHDTAILIDSTGSMGDMIETYKAEALRLARETLEHNGRVALYDYRDLDDPYEPVNRCDFESCDLDTFSAGLSSIQADGGGDTPESLLSASYHVMKELNWKVGHTKSLVVLTDALYLSPDRDGIDFDDVVRLSRIIDPVNFYIITTPEAVSDYQPLADETGGKVVTISDNLSLLTDSILTRSDSLPRVEIPDGYGARSLGLPAISSYEVEDNSSSITIRLSGAIERLLVTMNDAWLGITEDKTIIIRDLDRTIDNTIVITPLSDTMRGEPIQISLDMIIPKAPDTGVVK